MNYLNIQVKFGTLFSALIILTQLNKILCNALQKIIKIKKISIRSLFKVCHKLCEEHGIYVKDETFFRLNQNETLWQTRFMANKTPCLKLIFLIVICERNVCFFVVLHNHGLLY